MTEGNELHYGKLTLLISAIVTLAIVCALVFLGIWVCFRFGGYYLLLASVIFITAIILGMYGISMLVGFFAINKTQKLIGEHNYCPKCNRELQEDDKVCPFCGKKLNRYYLKYIDYNKEQSKEGK